MRRPLPVNSAILRRTAAPPTITANLNKYISGAQRTDQRKVFESILTVKWKLDIQYRGHLAVNFRQSVIIAKLWRPEVARPGSFVSIFCVFFEKKQSFSNCRYCADHAKNLPWPAPLLPNAWRPFLCMYSICNIYRLPQLQGYLHTRGSQAFDIKCTYMPGETWITTYEYMMCIIHTLTTAISCSTPIYKYTVRVERPGYPHRNL